MAGGRHIRNGAGFSSHQRSGAGIVGLGVERLEKADLIALLSREMHPVFLALSLLNNPINGLHFNIC
jgi:hypothetical protein